jgi:hypothetical protein
VHVWLKNRRISIKDTNLDEAPNKIKTTGDI